LDRVGAQRPAQAERPFHAVDVAEIGEVDAVLAAALPAQHDWKVRALVDEQAHGETWRALRFEDVGFALRGFGLTDVRERERIAWERGGKHAESETGEILLHADDSSWRRGLGRNLNEGIAAESKRRRA